MPERTPSHSTTSRSDGRISPSAIDSASIPKTGKSSTAQEIKSFVRKNLLASPDFPRLYADTVLHYAPNSHEAKILAPHYKKIVAYTERTKQLMSAKSCTHIKVSGVRCGSPALRGEQFCYFHQRMLRTVRYPASRIRHAALLEDEDSIQVALMETVNALLRGTLEIKRGELILRALNTAVRNIRRVHFGLHVDRMVKEIPDYPTPPLEQVDEQYAKELRLKEERAESARAREEILAQYQATQNKAKPANPSAGASGSNGSCREGLRGEGLCGDGLCGDGSQTRPGGPEVPGRSAPPPKPATPAEAQTRKPPVSVKAIPASTKTAAPKERKSAAHRASGG